MLRDAGWIDAAVKNSFSNIHSMIKKINWYCYEFLNNLKNNTV